MAGSDRKVLTVKFVAEGIEAVQRELTDLGKAGAAAASKLNSAFAKSSIGKELTQRLVFLKAALANTARAGKAFGDSWSNVGTKLKGFTTAIGSAIGRLLKFKAALAAAAVGAIALFKSFGNNAEQIQLTADAMGMTTDEYQRFAAAAKEVGIEQSKLDTIMTKFTVGVEEAGDEAEKATNKTDGLALTYKKLVRATDGTMKWVTIRRGIEEVAEETKKFEGVTKTGTDGLLQYAESLKAAGGPAEQLAKAVKDFGAKNGLAAVKFFNNLTFQFDDNARAAAGLIKPLTDLELLIGNNLDNAFDRAAQNVFVMKDRLLAVFSPSVTKLVEAFTHYIADNEQAMLEWAETTNRWAIGVLDDFFKLLADPDAVVNNQWLKPLIDGVKAFWTAAKYVFTVALPEAFTKIRGYADEAAKKINEIFGTDFTGDSLLMTIALGYVSGAFDIIIKGGWLVVSVIAAVGSTFRLAAAGASLFMTALRPLALALGYLGAALAALVGLPAWVGVAIVAALVIAAGLIYAYWDDIKVYAQQTWDAIVKIVSDAGGAIADSFGNVGAEWNAIFDGFKADGLKGALDVMKTQTEDFWSQFVADTKNEISLINDALQYIGIDLPGVWEHVSNGAKGLWADIVAGASALGQQLAPAWETVKVGASALWDGVTSTATRVWETVASIINNAASGIASAVSKVWNAATEAISGAGPGVLETAKTILASINDALTAAGDVKGAIDLTAKLAAPFVDAKDQIVTTWTDLAPALEAKGGDILSALSAPLDGVKNLPTAFSDALGAIPDVLTGLIPVATASMGQLVDAVVSATDTLSSRINEVFAGLSLNVNLSGIVAAFDDASSAVTSTWTSAMRSIVSQTQSMVSSVQSLISRLASYLNQLRASIASAKASASSSSKSSDGRAGRASGGYISGPGTGTSDSIPLWGSNGEFMIKASAVRHWGLEMLYALNNMRMPRFATGGLIGNMAASVSPRSFARPLDGAASRLSPYTLVFEGQEIPGFMGPSPDALRQIGKSRVISRIASNGRAPKWKG